MSFRTVLKTITRLVYVLSFLRANTDSFCIRALLFLSNPVFYLYAEKTRLKLHVFKLKSLKMETSYNWAAVL